MSDSKANSAVGASKKLGTIGLAAIVVSSMVGGGIFSLPQNMAASAGVGAVILAWIITGIGIFFIANTFKTLAAARPDLTAGIYMYSKKGFGEYAGFTIAWGYWLCQIFGNVGYAVITMDALNYFFPGWFTGGNNIESIIGGSILIWAFNFIVLRGIKQASAMNLVGTVGKLLPIAIFLIVMLFAFKWDKFTFDFWGHMAGDGETNLGGLSSQIKSTMLVTLWAFIGIEGAVVLSGRARSQSDVGKATILGFSGGLLVFALLSILPYGFMTQAELSNIANPSTAGVLEAVVGLWGAWLMNIGLLIAILASWLAWTMITAEIPYAASVDGTFPKAFSKSNVHNSPSVSLWVSSIIMQCAMLLVFFSNNAWNTMLSITGVMVLPPYLASTAYLWKISADGTLKSEDPQLPICVHGALISGVLGSLYALWLIYAAGLQYFLASIVFLALGIPVYIWARAERGQKPFTKYEGAVAALLSCVAILAIVLASTGVINVGLGGSTPTPPPPSPAPVKVDRVKTDSNPVPMSKRHGDAVFVKDKKDAKALSTGAAAM